MQRVCGIDSPFTQIETECREALRARFNANTATAISAPMSSLLDRPALLIAVTGSIFALAAFFTRAMPRRMAGALAGGVVFGLLNLAWDVVGYHMGWWWYRADTPRSLGPWYWYAAAGLEYGAGFGLIGWRATRRWGARGLLGFLIGFTLCGMTRDYVASSTWARDVIALAGGIWPWVADGMVWFSLAAMAQVVMRIVSGPAISDRLRGEPAG